MKAIQRKIITCNRCPRLRKYCAVVAEGKRAAYRDETYWGKPVPSFGDPRARLVIVGLAPAAHGANRTGRMFTGDRSGEWLYRALHKAGFANQASYLQSDDGLNLSDTWITAVVHCAPPDNKPNKEEIEACSGHLQSELKALKEAKVFLVLGGIALAGAWSMLGDGKSRPKFGHGVEVKLPTGGTLLMSYHPSQQNTFTKRLTETKFDEIFTRARALTAAKS